MNEHGEVFAYYYGFELTGVEAVDAILIAVAAAGKGYHSTEFWSDASYDGGPSYTERIQQSADEAAKQFAALVDTTGWRPGMVLD